MHLRRPIGCKSMDFSANGHASDGKRTYLCVWKHRPAVKHPEAYPQETQDSILFRTPEFARLWRGFGFWERHRLNTAYKKAIRKAKRLGKTILAENAEAAELLHRYYYVRRERIQIKK